MQVGLATLADAAPQHALAQRAPDQNAHAVPLGGRQHLGLDAAVDSTLVEIADALRRLTLEGAARVGLRARFVVRRGDPFVEICRVCDDVRADGVVVGASATLGHRLAGSLAVRLVRARRWPVTVVP